MVAMATVNSKQSGSLTVLKEEKSDKGANIQWGVRVRLKERACSFRFMEPLKATADIHISASCFSFLARPRLLQVVLTLDVTDERRRISRGAGVQVF